MWSCRRCRAQNEAFRNWCRSCNGTRYEALGASAAWQATTPAPPARGSGRVRPLTAVAIIAVLALVGAGAFVVLRPDDSSKVAAETPDPRTPEQIWADTATANAVKLTLADLPAGWH